MNPKIAFLDVDHTLTSRATGLRAMVEAVRRGYVPFRRLLVLPLIAFWYRLGVDRRRDGRFLPSKYPALRGLTSEQLRSLGEQGYRNKIRSDVYPEAPALIGRLRRNGYRIALATSSFDFIIEPLARELGVDGLIANSLEIRDGLTTGRLVDGMTFGRTKRDRCFAMMSELGAEPAACAFFSDSIHDLPLLEEVGTPVAVNPDPGLRRIARKRGWKILRFGLSTDPGI